MEGGKNLLLPHRLGNIGAMAVASVFFLLRARNHADIFYPTGQSKQVFRFLTNEIMVQPFMKGPKKMLVFHWGGEMEEPD